MHIIRHQTQDGKAQYEFFIEEDKDGSYRSYLVDWWGNVDLEVARKTTMLVKDGNKFYVTSNPPPRTANKAMQIAKLWTEEFDQVSSTAAFFETTRDPQIPSVMVKKAERKKLKPLMLKITSDVWEQIEATIGSKYAETGGPLGGSRDDFIVTCFHFDHSARRTGMTYSPDHHELNRLFREEWNPSGINLLGFVHSHPPNIWSPSEGDLIYARDILNAIPSLPYLLLPIVKTKPNTGAFEILPYAVMRDENDVSTVRLKLEITNACERGVDSDDFYYPPLNFCE